MKKLLLPSIFLLGLSASSAQAITLTPTLTFTGDYGVDGEIDNFYFTNNSTGQVSIWVDTLQDGLDAAGFLWKKNVGTGAYEYVAEIANASEPGSGTNTTGVNDYGVAIKNGYDVNDPFNNPGFSDPGATLNLDAGDYLYTATGFDWLPNALFFNGGSGTPDDGWTNTNEAFFFNDPEREWSTWSFNPGSASPYEIFVTGDVSAVPVPAAAWLFVSAIAGLGALSRRKDAAAC